MKEATEKYINDVIGIYEAQLKETSSPYVQVHGDTIKVFLTVLEDIKNKEKK